MKMMKIITLGKAVGGRPWPMAEIAGDAGVCGSAVVKAVQKMESAGKGRRGHRF